MYSRKVRHYLLNPVNGPPSNSYNYVGESETTVHCRTNPKRMVKNRIKFMVCIDDGRILGARWEAFGDPVSMAVSSWCVQKIRGKYVGELVHVITPEMATLELGITDPLDIRGGCTAALNALIAAIENYTQTL